LQATSKRELRKRYNGKVDNMVLTNACVAPHALEIIPELAGDQMKVFEETRRSMDQLGSQMREYHPETIALATPHGLRLDGTIGVVTSEYIEGSLAAHEKSLKMRFKCDRQLAQEILRKAREAKLPAIGANYGTSEGESSCMPMDWGTFIPLWFLGAQNPEQKRPKVVIVTPSREIPLQQLVEFGSVIAEVAETSGKRVSFVASADQGHAHDAKGPYGFHPASARFDRMVQEAVEKNDLKRLLSLDPKFIEDAKPDSLWQMAILIGVLDRVPMKRRFVSYQRPTYFGMLCSSYTRK